MSFISPYFLFGLIGIGIPLIIHLSRREKAPTVVFSTLKFLRRVNRKLILFQRVKQWLLLMMRIAVIALLALAFARPFMTGTSAQITGMNPQSTVLLIDVSMSMQFGDYFKRTKDEAIRILHSLRPVDEAAIVTFSQGIEQIRELTTDHAQLESFVQDLNPPGYFSTRILTAMRIADQILQKAQYQDRSIYLISDFQTRAFDGLNSSFRLSPGVKFHGIKIADAETMNLAVTEVKSPEKLSGEEESCVIQGHVKNMGNIPLSEAGISLIIDGKTVDTKTIDLKNKSDAVVSFKTNFEGPDTRLCSISVDDPAFPSDNSFFFTLSVFSRSRILCVDGEPAPDHYLGESYWFRRALGGHEDSTFNIEVIRQENLTQVSFEEYDVICLLNSGNLSGNLLMTLESYVAKGGNLLLAPADRVEAETFNRLFVNLTPALLVQKKLYGERNSLGLSQLNNRHPILQGQFSDQNVDFGAARFKGIWLIEPVEGSNVIIGFDNGAAAFVERSVGRGRILLFASSLDTEWNNLPLHVAYLPLLHETMRYLTRRGDRKQSYTAGEVIPLAVPHGKFVRVVNPEGTVKEPVTASEDLLFYDTTYVPGFYKIRTSKTTDYFVVNVPTEESDLSTINLDEVLKSISNPEREKSISEDALTSVPNIQLEKNQQLWWYILVMVFLLGIIETILAVRTYR